MRVVLDANVLVSAFLNSEGASRRILNLVAEGELTLVTCEAALTELARVLSYPRLMRRYAIEPAQAAEYVSRLMEIAVLVEEYGIPAMEDFADPDDLIYLAVAVAAAGGAEYIVSGDRHLLELGQHVGIPIMSPADFMRWYATQRPA